MLAVLLLAVAREAQGYVGPGAGFAVLSTFLAFAIAFLLAIAAILAAPVRRVFDAREIYRGPYVENAPDPVGALPFYSVELPPRTRLEFSKVPTMNSRERLLIALDGGVPDRVPIS
ncbi:hypothetical protein FJY63_11360, partial [Candidatus Sumerlaeota bacterium]|nr:hypothetical protein [Candidatus Sumerlaeota bacterium]